MQVMDVAELRSRVDGLVAERDPMRRRLLALGALTARLAPEGIEPILGGGCALEVYTDGGYTTSDVDLALPHSPAVDRAFEDLGFEKRGRFWVRMEPELLFEAPAPAGLPGETAPRTELSVDGLRVIVLGVEDLLIDRLRAWVHWKSDEDGRWASRLVSLYRSEMDWAYLRAKVEADDGERAALERLEKPA
jgi:predicted nucleotidyltransferase